MYGLNVCGGDFARFVSSDRAHTAATRLLFVAKKGCRARVKDRVHRGEFLGYAVVLSGSEGEYEVTEGDVLRFGL